MQNDCYGMWLIGGRIELKKLGMQGYQVPRGGGSNRVHILLESNLTIDRNIVAFCNSILIYALSPRILMGARP